MDQRTPPRMNVPLSRQVYAKESRVPPDLAASVGVALLLSLLVRVHVLIPFRVIAGLAIGLVIPGYLLVCWIFPKRESLKGWERAGVVLVSNIAIIIMMGLLMALFKIPLVTITVANTLTVLIVVLAAIVFWTRQNDPTVEPAWDFSWVRSKRVRAAVLLMVALSGFVWYVVGTNLNKQYTAFSLTNTHDQLSGYPYLLQPKQLDPMRLNIFNPSQATQSYVVIERTAGRIILRQPVTVAPKHHWFQIIDLPTVGVGPLVHLHFILTTGKGETIRQLWITYHVAP